jgi:predicted ATP-binding protein involved in virulence
LEINSFDWGIKDLLIKAYVKDLFGYLTYEINFAKVEGNVVLIHGPNGSGKTTIFKMIESISNKRFDIFFKTPFTTFTLETNNLSLTIEKINDRLIRFNNEHDLEYNPLLESNDSDDIEEINRILHSYGAIRVGARYFEYEGKEYFYKDLIKKIRLKENSESPQPEIISAIVKELNILYIGAERLFNNDLRKVVDNTNRLKGIIQSFETKYGILSKDLDAKFPKKIIKSGTIFDEKLQSEEIVEKLQKLSVKRNQLTKKGILSDDNSSNLIPANEITIDDIVDNQHLKQFLNFYLDDNETKLDVFDELLEKINTFERIIKGYFVNKKIHVSKKDGYVIELTKGKLKGMPIPLESLSSGEQHFLVLFFELIFSSDKNFIVLVDEPEISLHISWQVNMVEALIEVAELSNTYFVLATHSPSILRNHKDKVLPVGYAE